LINFAKNGKKINEIILLKEGGPITKLEEISQHFIVDDQLWKDLQSADPAIISQNCQVQFNAEEKYYLIPVLNEIYKVFPKEKILVKTIPDNSIPEFQVELTLFLLHYLLGTKAIPLKGILVSEKDLKGGEMFFRGPHSLSVTGVIRKFGNDPEGFIAAGLRLNGKRVLLGDAAIELKPAPLIPLTYVLWKEDEEFPAAVKILFDPTIQEFLPLDVIYGITMFVSHRLIEV